MRGSPFRLSDRQGKAVLLTFGYTSCPDVCPATLAMTRQALAAVGEGAEDVAVVFVTTDPVRDTPQVIEAYLANFGPAFLGLTGDPLSLAQAMSDYGIDAEPNPRGLPGLNYEVDHTARLYLIDPAGRLRAQYPFGVAADDLRQDVEHILAGG
jgi:protein SCO1/2